MLPIISVVGKSGAGKTALVAKIVAELKSREYRVATVKHSARGFDLDTEGKDSWHHSRAGSDTVSISSPHKFALIRNMDHDAALSEIPRLIGWDFDIVVAEGFRHDKAPKIEVHRKELGTDLLCTREELMAIASDGEPELDVPRYSPDDAAGIVDLIEKLLLSERDADTAALYVNGESVHLNSFVRSILSNTLFGIVSSLKGVSKATSVDISIRRKHSE
jgi:molybdopterin-guanine dinucleotide biosynthesis protein B